MPGQIIHLPAQFMKPNDPREQDVDEPSPVVRALESMNHGGECVGCGLPTRFHWTISGAWIGCQGALTQGTPPRDPQRWNDPYPAVTCEARKSLLLNCGPVMEIHCSGAYTHDELLTIAHQLAKDIIAAYQRELAK